MEMERRIDGFSGQHLVVVPRSVQDSARRSSLLSGLIVTDAGYFPHAGGHLVERKEGCRTHLVISCLRGRGWVQDRTGRKNVEHGDLVWLRANQPHSYGSEDSDPWTIGWAHFMGDEAEEWRKFVGFSDEPAAVLSHANAEGAAALKLEQIYLSLEQGYSTTELIGASLLLRGAFAAAGRAIREGASNRTPADRIATVRDHMRDQLDQPHRLEELASAAGLSVPHFSALFRRQTGYSPIDYLIRQRIQRACQLLDTSALPIATVARAVGYEDAYYFARCFRRIVGSSPSAYRKVPKG